MYMWEEFDIGEVREDMARIADMGFEVVRMFTRTKDFLPTPSAVDTVMVQRLLDVVQTVGDAGLMVVPTVIILNMSGSIWWPDWILGANGTPADLYSDPSVVRSQRLLASACAGAA